MSEFTYAVLRKIKDLVNGTTSYTDQYILHEIVAGL